MERPSRWGAQGIQRIASLAPSIALSGKVVPLAVPVSFATRNTSRTRDCTVQRGDNARKIGVVVKIWMQMSGCVLLVQRLCPSRGDCSASQFRRGSVAQTPQCQLVG
uniref:Uncharacterized protein n=1 Tax=Noctiluca scintillans TaxID=2966 RepID=A0A7S1A5C5_NOCSC